MFFNTLAGTYTAYWMAVTGEGERIQQGMHALGHLALIALGHAPLALADQPISVSHAAVVLSQWLHLVARLALLCSTIKQVKEPLTIVDGYRVASNDLRRYACPGL